VASTGVILGGDPGTERARIVRTAVLSRKKIGLALFSNIFLSEHRWFGGAEDWPR
jgi:hypothetical protein